MSRNSGDEHTASNEHTRRSFLTSAASSLLVSSLIMPHPANAGIDVSGIRVEGDLNSQIRTMEKSAPPEQTPSAKLQSTMTSQNTLIPGAATNVKRTTVGPPFLKRAGPTGLLSSYQDTLIMENSSSAQQQRFLNVNFEFPSDWLQLDRVLGGIQFVDQRNGDKLYVLCAPAPSSSNDDTVKPTPKDWYGDVLFNSKDGAISKSGNVVEEYRVSSAQTLSQVQSCSTGNGVCTVDTRRLTIKYATVTGNGYRVERRALVSATEINGIVYMMVTSSNAVKFDQKGAERETVENIINSFRIQEA